MNNMNGIGSYGAMAKNIYSSSAQSRKTAKADDKKTNDTKKTTGSSVQLSDKAKALLQELKKTYNNADFYVAEYESEEEASEYLSRGTKDYSVLIDPEELERMANDDEVKEQNLALLDESLNKLGEMKEALKETGREDEVVNLGVHIGSDGKVSYFAELEKAGERQREFVEKIVEDKREAAKEAEAEKNGKGPDRYNYEHSKRATVTADSVDDLLAQITNFNWDNVKEETTIPMPGKNFDFTV
ncbi:MAG: DUF6033 family protein [Bacteroidales bacterium]|nr:DUF6033 family protein [Bacteroidales bacterium]MCM1415342.1 DUF6033 family protein [bacterium]MCM1424017.1 DUF6033 family protein [bacterium]